jgi:hypothetical protein
VGAKISSVMAPKLDAKKSRHVCQMANASIIQQLIKKVNLNESNDDDRCSSLAPIVIEITPMDIVFI